MQTDAVTNKRENMRRFIAGEYGNTIRTWLSLDDFYRSGFDRQVVLRSYRPGSPFCTFFVEPSDLPALVAGYVARGADRSEFYVNEQMPDAAAAFHAELYRSEEYLTARYAYLPGPQRPAFAAPGVKHVSGLAALLELEHRLDAPSMDNLRRLWDEYPDHVIELSAWNVAVGTLGWRSVVWEVRAF